MAPEGAGKADAAKYLAKIDKEPEIDQFSFDFCKHEAENRAQHLASKVFRSR